jgi:hypothetical protein
MSSFTEQLQKMKTHPGFIAALDQSGGSTPKALQSYGIKEDAWSNEAEMFGIVHRMRTRIIVSDDYRLHQTELCAQPGSVLRAVAAQVHCDNAMSPREKLNLRTKRGVVEPQPMDKHDCTCRRLPKPKI